VLDLDEDLLDVVEAIDIVMWPVAMDFKKDDLMRVRDGSIAAAFVNGAVRTTEQAEMAHLIRAKADIVVAFGSCAQLGGVPGLANLSNREGIFDAVYKAAQSVLNPEGTVPMVEYREKGRAVTLPGFFDTVRTLGQVIEVDYTIPGCPPTPKLLAGAVHALLEGTLPARGAVLAPDVALCDECPRKATRPEKTTIAEFKRPHKVFIDPEKCIMAQGLLCMGPATRSACGARCVRGNMPCTGCFGPTSRVRNFGAKALSAVASIAAATEEKEVIRILDGIPDPVGSFYRYSLAASVLRRKKLARAGEA
jgi:F420-non-reducing hydrogenase small subunit